MVTVVIRQGYPQKDRLSNAAGCSVNFFRRSIMVYPDFCPDTGRQKTNNRNVLVLGGTGKTGRRVVERLEKRNCRVRVGSRKSETPFDWNRPQGWAAALKGVDAAYIAYAPDLTVPGARDHISAFVDRAAEKGVTRVVLLTGRGEVEAVKCEQILRESGLEWTILRASWFNQNFSEAFLHDAVVSGHVALPVGAVGEPFIDCEDIADVATAALTEDGHARKLYELTGPRLISFAEAIEEISQATGRPITFEPISADDFASGMAAQGVSREETDLVRYLFTTLLDGRNESTADGVHQALGRPPRDFSEYVRTAARQGVWGPVATPTS